MHYVKIVQIWSFFWSVFSRIQIQSECREIRTRKNSVFGQISHSDGSEKTRILAYYTHTIYTVLYGYGFYAIKNETKMRSQRNWLVKETGEIKGLLNRRDFCIYRSNWVFLQISAFLRLKQLYKVVWCHVMLYLFLSTRVNSKCFTRDIILYNSSCAGNVSYKKRKDELLFLTWKFASKL